MSTTAIIIGVVVLVALWQLVGYLVFGMSDDGDSLLEIARHNRELYRSGRANRNVIVMTSIRPDLGQDKTTASGYVEKSVVIRERK